MVRKLIAGSALALTSALAPGIASAEGQYDGVVINILTRPGPVIAGRLAERGEEFKEMTGAEVRVAEVPFAEIFQKLLTDWATGTNCLLYTSPSPRD